MALEGLMTVQTINTTGQNKNQEKVNPRRLAQTQFYAINHIP
jgi:hypothetical protein